MSNLMSKFNSPLVKNLFANFCSLGIALLSQIVLVPFYIYYWGNDLYSDWIVLSALTAFFGMTDVGLNTVIHNRFAIQKAKGEMEECNSLIVNNFVIVGVIFTICIILSTAYILLFDLNSQMSIHQLSRSSANWVFILLMCQVFLRMFGGIENSIFRAVHKAHVAIYIDQIANLAIVVLTFISVYMGISMPVMCFLLCCPNIITLLVKHWLSKRIYVYKFSLNYVDLGLVKRLLLPSISFLSIPLSNAIVLQGFTLVVNKFFGADATVIYNTTRTMCNFIKQVLNQINYSASPEYSIAYGKSDFRRMLSLYKKAFIMSMTAMSSIIVLLLAFGPLIFDVWTHNQIVFDYPLMISFLIVTLIETIWMPSREVVISTNNHMRMCYVFLGTSVVSIALATILSLLDFSLPSITYTQIFIHLITGLVTIKISNSIINKKVQVKSWNI